MNKSESKYFNTAVLMDDALLRLLEKKDFEYITVKEICEKAGVNRSTFYLHYETVADLLTECIERFNQQFFSRFSETQKGSLSDIEHAPLDDLVLINSEFLSPYLSFIKEHKSLYKAVYKNPACLQANRMFHYISENILHPIMNRFHIPLNHQPYWIAFYIQGSTAIIQEWVNEGCKDSVEEVESILIQCIRPQIKTEKE